MAALGCTLLLLLISVADSQKDYASIGQSAVLHCPAECTCGIGDDDTAVSCENQELQQLPQVPVQTTSLRLGGNSFGDLPVESFDGLSRLKLLNFTSSGLHSLTADHLRPLRSLRALLLAGNGFASLSEDVFLPVARSLEELDLSGDAQTRSCNGLGRTAAALGRMLRPLAVLRSLRLSCIGLRDVASLTEQMTAAVGAATTLEELVLSSNELAVLDARSFAGLAGYVRLRRVSIADSKIRSVQTRTFDHLSSVSDLDLSGNVIPPGELNRTLVELGVLGKLRRLSLARMNISRLNGLFDTADSQQIAPRLLSLDLSGNLIVDVGKRRFYAAKALQVLDLSGNQIRALDSESFSGLSALSQLSLARNRLQTVNARAFENLPQLARLDLSGNQLPTLELSAFGSLFNLERLDVSGNNIATIRTDDSGGSLEMLQELSIAGNQISGGLVELLLAVGRVRVLDASRNRIGSLPSALLPSHSTLAVLNVSHNVISDVGATTFTSNGAAALRTLDLSHNRLARIPALRRGIALSWLSLRSNRIETLGSRSLPVLSDLRELDIGDNELRWIDAAALAGVPALRVLRADGNALGPFLAGERGAASSPALASATEGSSSAGKLTAAAAGPPAAAAAALAGGLPESQLEELDLSSNEAIQLADGLFANLTSLRTLNLSGNRLTSLTARQLVGLGASLVTLDLSSNNFTQVDARAFASLAALSAVDVSRNPFDCRDPCHTQSFRRLAADGTLPNGRPVSIVGYHRWGRYTCGVTAGSGETRSGARLSALPMLPSHSCPVAMDDGPEYGSRGGGGSGSSSEEKTIILAVIGCTAFVVLVVAVAVFWQHRVRLRRKLRKQQHYQAVLDHSATATGGADGCAKPAATSPGVVGTQPAAYKCQQALAPSSLLCSAAGQQQQQPLLSQWHRTSPGVLTQGGGGSSSNSSSAGAHGWSGGQKCGTAYV